LQLFVALTFFNSRRCMLILEELLTLVAYCLKTVFEEMTFGSY